MHQRAALMLMAGAMLLAGARSVGATWRQDALPTAIRHLQRTAAPVPGGPHLAILRSLRQLHDPALEPLFRQLLSSTDPIVQIHAVLGLAEIHEPPALDPWLVGRLPTPAAQEAAIDNAIAMQLLDLAAMRELLSWKNLDATPRVRLLAELHAAGEDVDAAALAELASAPTRAGALASCLLAQRGDAAAVSALRTRTDTLTGPARDAVLRQVFEEIRRYRLTALYDWVATVLEQPGLDRELIGEGVFTALYLDPVRGVSIWRRALGDAPGLSERVRFALLLFAVGEDIPAATYDIVAQPDHTLLTTLIAAGKALSTDTNVAVALNALIDLGHVRSTNLAVRHAAHLPAAAAADVYEHLIDRVDGDSRGMNERLELAILGASRLYDVAPARLVARLEATPDDSPTQEAILMGLFDTTDDRVGQIARDVRRLGAARADSLAWLLLARHAASLSPDEIRQISLIASGGGQVSDGLRAQAAWILIRATGNVDRALLDIFNESPNGGRS